ncbi:MAG TPA: hypothetical protein VGX25_31360 [Actinophytocola sp.]|uniref:hypothetical protein n=1 Tax=Actinophytocola sp. TaxID=1872138 RepID=UPI002DDD35F3|nr:hypothetical protein [Actinophytocola sp.]HEV2783908.1 hypothetical protein [Actinophytocola sp.]
MASAERTLGVLGAEAEFDAHFEAALGFHAHTLDGFETARTQLAYGARLRRARRRVAARPQLRAALTTFERLRAAPWADRAASELAATGEAIRRSAPNSVQTLTPQELQVSLLLAEGRTTREVAAALFLQPQDRRVPPAQGLSQARYPLPRRAGRPAALTSCRPGTYRRNVHSGVDMAPAASTSKQKAPTGGAGPRRVTTMSAPATTEPFAPAPHDAAAAVDPRYATLRDPRLAAALTAEDHAEHAGADPLERLTCRTHRRWVHQCISSASHVFVVTGHRWCRTCECAATVSVDELTWAVTVTCPRCRRPPDSAATRQIVRTCRASLAAARGE